MKLAIPQGYTPDVAVIESKLNEAKFEIDVMQKNGFDPADINTVVENKSATDIDGAIACVSILEGITIQEAIVKHVDSQGNITRTKDRETRERNAFQTTGLTKAARRQIARKAVKTKRANPSIGVKAKRKTKKALKKRKALGLS